MPEGSRVKPRVRRGSERLSALRWGQAPVFFVAFVTSGLLWGTGHDLPATSITAGRTALRTGIAWLAAMFLLLALAYPILGLAVSLIRGPRPQNRLMRGLLRGYFRSGTARQTRRRAQAQARRQPERYGWDSTQSVDHRFPLSDPVRPTALGNAEAALVDRVYRRYSLEVGRILPLLVNLMSDRDAERLAAAERRADIALYSAAGWLVATIWVVPITWVLALFGMTVGTRNWVPGFAVASIAVTLIFYTTRYSQAITRAIEYGSLLESDVDIYRLDLLETLGFRRPRPSEEREFFAELPGVFAGRPIDERYRRDNGASENPAGEAELRQIVSESVERGLQRYQAGPELDNYDGYLSVIMRDNGRAVPPDEDGQVTVSHDHNYDLVIVIGGEPRPGAATAPLRIRNGNEPSVVPFAVSVDSNVPALRLAEQPFPVTRTEDRELDVPLPIGPSGKTPTWLWIRVTQHDRTIQNLELMLHGEDRSA